MNKKSMISKAIAFAVEKHHGQFDRGGMPYILHPLKVMHYLKTDDEELMCVAVLHDVIEDWYLKKLTHLDTLDIFNKAVLDLKEIGMSERVILSVTLLTKTPDIDYQPYIEIIAHDPYARKVKMADLRHNMDIRRLKGVTKEDIERLERYAKAYEMLKSVDNKG